MKHHLSALPTFAPQNLPPVSCYFFPIFLPHSPVCHDLHLGNIFPRKIYISHTSSGFCVRTGAFAAFFLFSPTRFISYFFTFFLHPRLGNVCKSSPKKSIKFEFSKRGGSLSFKSVSCVVFHHCIWKGFLFLYSCKN